MKFLKTYLPLLIGASILFTANTESLKTPYLYILGIVLIMLGLYNISKGVRRNTEDDNPE